MKIRKNKAVEGLGKGKERKKRKRQIETLVNVILLCLLN
jgi:hypothetical protein